MKRKICGAVLLVFMATAATAQHQPPAHMAKKQTAKSNPVTAKENRADVGPQAGKVVNDSGAFSNYGSYPAKRNLYPYTGLQISDPTIRAFNKQAYGRDTSVPTLGVIGVPKRAYGIVNGHLIFRSSSATSSGTITGSGEVGTGSSVGSAGAGGQVIGVNGKSPYAGPGMWGTKVAGQEIRPNDRNIRDMRVKKKE